MASSVINVCTFNALSLSSAARLADFEANVRKVRFSVIGLAETRRRQVGCTSLGSGNFLYNSWHDSDGRGVGFYVSGTLNRFAEGVRYISGRIIQIVFKLRGNRKLRLTQVHAPHSGYSDEDYDKFLEELQNSISDHSYYYDLILGDFNAEVGTCTQGERFLGKFGLGTRNDRGESLLAFCESLEFWHMNSRFRKSEARRWTWRSPDRRTLKEIDFVLSRRRECVTDVSVLARFDSNSDHRLVRATLHIHHRLHSKPKERALPPQYDRVGIQVRMNMLVGNFVETGDHHRDWTSLKSMLKEVADKCSKRQEKTRRLSTRTKDLFKLRASLKHGLSQGAVALLDYVTVCKAIRWSIEEDLRSHHRRVLEKAISTNCIRRGRMELAYQRKQLSQVRQADGTLTTSIEELAECASSFFEEIYASRHGSFRFSASGRLERPLNSVEIIQACARVRNRACPGADGIPSIITKHCVPIVAEHLADALNGMFETDRIPESIAVAKTILLLKKGDPLELANYRPISLLSTVYKVVTRILTRRVEEAVANRIPVEQAGFRRGFSTVDHILTLNLLLEKSREWSLPIHLVFIDFKKAFDSVELPELWNALEYYNVDPTTVRMIKQLYSSGSSFLATGGFQRKFETQKGVRQGDSLSPLLFIVCLQYVLDRIDWNQHGIAINDRRLCYLAYADDIALVSRSVPDLQQMLNTLAEECSKVGLSISIVKTKWMGSSDSSVLSLGNETIEKVDSFVYLGQLIRFPRLHAPTPRFMPEIKRRVRAAWCAYARVKEFLRNPRVDIKLKRKYFHTCILPAFLYGCESWALTKGCEEVLGRAQRAMERRMLRIRLRDKIRSSAIRRRTGLKDIVVESRKRKWKHLAKLVSREERWDIRLLDWTPALRRPRGRPPTRWQDEFRKNAGVNWRAEATTDRWQDIALSFAISAPL
jgi:hypothetical protein